MAINWDSVEGAIAGLTDAPVFEERLKQLKAATGDVARAAAAKARYDTAQQVHADAAAMLVKAREHIADLSRQADVWIAREKELLEREKRLAEREDEVTRREREVEQKREHLVEVAKRYGRLN
jgi:hypothetical protein